MIYQSFYKILKEPVVDVVADDDDTLLFFLDDTHIQCQKTVAQLISPSFSLCFCVSHLLLYLYISSC